MARLGDDSDSGTESSLEEEVVQSESDDEEEVVVSDDSEEEIEIEEGDADGEEEIVEPLGESYEEVIDIGDDMEDEIILEEPVTQDSGFYVDEILEDDEPAVQEDESRRGAAEEARDEPVFESYTTRTPPPPQEDARKAAAVAPVAIAASPTLSNSATGPIAKGDEDEEVHRPPGELPRIDILLIVLIVIAAIIVVTILCVLYANPGTGPATPIPPKPTVAPSLAPQVSMAPTSVEYLPAGTFTGPTGSQLGAATAVEGLVAVAGAPGTASVTAYISDSGSYRESTSVTGPSGSAFGQALAMFGAGVLVGAPNADTSYFYFFAPESQTWDLFGNEMTAASSGEAFGAAVARSLEYRVAIGAPLRNGGDGGVYTYDYSSESQTWVALTEAPIGVNGSQEEAGAALDMSVDGQRIVVGAPANSGGSGRVFLSVWNAGLKGWLQIIEKAGGAGELFGTSVTFLTLSGDTFAAGAPGANGGNGAVRVYQQVEDSLTFNLLGSEIVGEGLDAIGAAGTIAGTDGLLVVGTSSGLVKMYEFDSESKSWLQVRNTLESGVTVPVSSASTSTGADKVIAGFSASDTVQLFQAFGKRSAVPTNVPVVPVANPIAAPVSTPTPTVMPIGTQTLLPTSGPSSAPISTTTSGPTAAPVSVLLPTASPSINAAPTALAWTQSGGPFLGNSGDDLGASVAMLPSSMAAGSPAGSGLVRTYSLINDQWVANGEILGVQDGSGFGSSVVLNPSDRGMVVGAPGAVPTGSSFASGAAYYYRFNGTNWNAVGGQMSSSDQSAGENFGTSVASSLDSVVVVGAPGSGPGRVSAFVYDPIDTNSWVPRGSGSTVVGEASGDAFGSLVDVSDNGSTMLVGAPGSASGSGMAYVYTWDGSSWVRSGSFAGGSGERLGSSVTFLTSDGSVIAVGSPGAASGQGQISVYQLQNASGSSSYVLAAPPIVGESGDVLGDASSFTGTIDSSLGVPVPVILASTATGLVRTYFLNPLDSSWQQPISPVTTSAGTSRSVAGSTASQTFVIGSGNTVDIYSL